MNASVQMGEVDVLTKWTALLVPLPMPVSYLIEHAQWMAGLVLVGMWDECLLSAWSLVMVICGSTAYRQLRADVTVMCMTNA